MKNNEDKNYKLKTQSAEQDYAKERRFSIRNILQPVLPLINLGIKFLSKIFPRIFDRTNYEITAYSIVSQRVTKPIRIVQLSDLHNSVFGSDNEKFTNDIAGLVPDIILITGDMIIADDHNYSLLTNFLTSLLKKTEVPVYYILGNHEDDEILWHGTKLIHEIRSTGAIILENESDTIRINENEIAVGGLNIRSGRVKGHSAAEMLIDLQKSSKFRILLEHYPEYFLYLKKKKAMLDIDLALAGHAHGGVARIPHIGSLYAPGQGFFPKLTEGRHKFGTGFVVISRGLGGRPFPPRINNKPEIVVIDVASICKK